MGAVGIKRPHHPAQLGSFNEGAQLDYKWENCKSQNTFFFENHRVSNHSIPKFLSLAVLDTVNRVSAFYHFEYLGWYIADSH